MILPAAAFEGWLRRLAGYEHARVASITPVDGGASNITCRAVLAEAPVAAVALRIQRDRGLIDLGPGSDRLRTG